MPLVPERQVIQVRSQCRQDVRRHGDRASSGGSLGRADDSLSNHGTDDGPLYSDRAVQQIDIAALQTQNLPASKLTPCRHDPKPRAVIGRSEPWQRGRLDLFQIGQYESVNEGTGHKRQVPRRKLILSVVGAVTILAAIGIPLGVHFSRNSGISDTDGLTPSPPTLAQVSAMNRYYAPYASKDLDAAPVGCAMAKPLATRRMPNGEIEAFVQMLCAQCPPGESQQELPVAFRLDGDMVTSAQAADAMSDPGFYDQIREYFPHQLWAAANDGALSTRQAQSALSGAFANAGCRGA
jgi:hypothetical protein